MSTKTVIIRQNDAQWINDEIRLLIQSSSKAKQLKRGLGEILSIQEQRDIKK